MEVRYSLVYLGSNYDWQGGWEIESRLQLWFNKYMEVRYSLVDSSSNLGSNYDWQGGWEIESRLQL